MVLTEIAQLLSGTLHGDDCVFTCVSIDSRTLQVGELFVAITGENFDGHHYLQAAVNAGACAAVVSRYQPEIALPQLVVADTVTALGLIAKHNRRHRSARVVALTGSCGKTTVKGMLNSICSAKACTVATKGNLNNHIGVPLSLLNISDDHKYAVIEAGASGEGEISYLGELIEPDVALVNNVNAAHIEGFGSLDGVASEKAALYTSLSETGIAVINLDDHYAAQFLEQNAERQSITFSRHARVSCLPSYDSIEPTVTVSNVVIDSIGCASMTMIVAHKRIDIALKVLGQHNVQNALAAAACANALGIEAEYIQRGLSSYSGESGRMQLRRHRFGGYLIDDTYNANPGSMRAAINYLSHFERSVLVMGNMAELGDNEVEEHQNIASYAKTCGVTQLLTVGVLADHAVPAFGDGAHAFATQQALIEYLDNALRDGDVVLVKGSRSSLMEKVVNAIVKNEEHA